MLWPPRSPDLIPLHLFFYIFLKKTVYFESVESPEDVVACIPAGVTFIDKNVLQSVCDSIINRANVCFKVGVDLFKHLL